MDAFEKLLDRNTREEQRRGVIARKLDEIDSKGIETVKIRTYLNGDTETLNSEYDFFKEQVKRLIKLKAAILRDAYKKKDDSLKEKANSFSDPYRIDEYEASVSGKVTPAAKDPETIKVDIATLLEKARVSYKSMKLQEALGYYDAIIAIDPDHKEGNFYRKKILMKLKAIPASDSPAAKESEGAATPQPEQAAAKAQQESKGDPNCISCGGTGQCSWCKGTGKCSTCSATGKYFGDTCTTCKGSGRCNVCDGKGACSWCVSAK
jgi:tetratricopeptide (TPR) repeat protein